RLAAHGQRRQERANLRAARTAGQDFAHRRARFFPRQRGALSHDPLDGLLEHHAGFASIINAPNTKTAAAPIRCIFTAPDFPADRGAAHGGRRRSLQDRLLWRAFSDLDANSSAAHCSPPPLPPLSCCCWRPPARSVGSRPAPTTPAPATPPAARPPTRASSSLTSTTSASRT